MRPRGRSSRINNGSRRRYCKDAAISGGREADEKTTNEQRADNAGKPAPSILPIGNEG